MFFGFIVMAVYGVLGLVSLYMYCKLQVELYSSQYGYFKDLSEDVSERLACRERYVFDFDTEHCCYKDFKGFDSCMGMCESFLEDPWYRERLNKAFLDAGADAVLEEDYRHKLMGYSFERSDHDRIEYSPWMPKLLWEWLECRLIKSCRPEFHTEVVARCSWHWGPFRETFEYDGQALRHMFAWCEGYRDDYSCGELPEVDGKTQGCLQNFT